MKKNILATTAVLAALVGLSQIAQADSGCHTFTPIDELPPQTRQEINARLEDLLKNIEVDWDGIVVGINEGGEITIRAKSETDMKAMGSYSCYGEGVPRRSKRSWTWTYRMRFPQPLWIGPKPEILVRAWRGRWIRPTRKRSCSN
jgi:hypothetical protein